MSKIASAIGKNIEQWLVTTPEGIEILDLFWPVVNGASQSPLVRYGSDFMLQDKVAPKSRHFTIASRKLPSITYSVKERKIEGTVMPVDIEFILTVSDNVPAGDTNNDALDNYTPLDPIDWLDTVADKIKLAFLRAYVSTPSNEVIITNLFKDLWCTDQQDPNSTAVSVIKWPYNISAEYSGDATVGEVLPLLDTNLQVKVRVPIIVYRATGDCACLPIPPTGALNPCSLCIDEELC